MVVTRTVTVDVAGDAALDAQRHALLEAQARRIAVLQARMQDLQAEVDGLKAQILDQWPAGSYEAAGLKVQVREGARRLDAARFAEAYPAADHPAFYKVAPDVAAARHELGEAALEPFMRRGRATVVVG